MRRNRNTGVGLRKLVLSASMGLYLCLSGCVIHPYHEKHAIATRYVGKTRVSEELMASETGLAYTALFAPCYAGGTTRTWPLIYDYYIKDYAGNSKSGPGLDFLNDFYPPMRRSSEYSSRIWPIAGTELWAALEVRHDSTWALDHRSLIFDITVFNSSAVVGHRELRAWSDEAYRPYKVDTTGAGILYQTTDSHQMNVYDILNDDTSPWTR